MKWTVLSSGTSRVAMSRTSGSMSAARAASVGEAAAGPVAGAAAEPPLFLTALVLAQPAASRAIAANEISLFINSRLRGYTNGTFAPRPAFIDNDDRGDS